MEHVGDVIARRRLGGPRDVTTVANETPAAQLAFLIDSVFGRD